MNVPYKLRYSDYPGTATGPPAEGGPFLPLAGGELSGPLTINNNVTYSAASAHSMFVNGIYSGTTTDTGQPTHNLFLAYDNAQAPNSNSVANVANYYTLTGGSVGARIAQQISFVVSGNTADPPGNTHFFQGLACTATINGTLGGTAGTYAGSITGNNTIATLGPNGNTSAACWAWRSTLPRWLGHLCITREGCWLRCKVWTRWKVMPLPALPSASG